MAALTEVRTIFILEPEVSYAEINKRLEGLGYRPISIQRLRNARCATKDVIDILLKNAESLGITFQPGVSDRLRYTSLMRKKASERETYEDITRRFHQGAERETD